MARPGTCSTVPETTKTTKFEESRHRPAMCQDGVMWQVNLRGANLASQSSMRAMMEPRAAASDLVQTKRLKNVKKNTQELSMVIFGRWLSISSEHSLVMLVGRLMLEETGTLWYLVQNVVTACTKLAFLATLWFTNWSDTNIFRVLPDMFVHKYPRIGEAANSNGWLY